VSAKPEPVVASVVGMQHVAAEGTDSSAVTAEEPHGLLRQDDRLID
jgi:hypothetical protein